jgi:hypothetical protein
MRSSEKNYFCRFNTNFLVGQEDIARATSSGSSERQSGEMKTTGGIFDRRCMLDRTRCRQWYDNQRQWRAATQVPCFFVRICWRIFAESLDPPAFTARIFRVASVHQRSWNGSQNRRQAAILSVPATGWAGMIRHQEAL